MDECTQIVDQFGTLMWSFSICTVMSLLLFRHFKPRSTMSSPTYRAEVQTCLSDQWHVLIVVKQ